MCMYIKRDVAKRFFCYNNMFNELKTLVVIRYFIIVQN